MSKRARKLSERIRNLQRDPSNEAIARVADAGEIVDGHLVMHNGLQVRPMDSVYMELLQANRGCHEPQEEMVFQEVLKHIRRGGGIIELGAYWGFYSMWFAKEIQDARCYLVEPEPRHLEVGKANFAKNRLRGEFFCSKIGRGHLGIDKFMDEQAVDFVDVLHADIQGAEYEMLCDAENVLRDGRIGYVFVGTHSQALHYRCKDHLQQRGYLIIADADYAHGTFCEDGVLVARHRSLDGVEPMEIPQRETAQQPYHAWRDPAFVASWVKEGIRSVFQRRKAA
jgi:predicted O-methyltransferase YrrM